MPGSQPEMSAESAVIPRWNLPIRGALARVVLLVGLTSTAVIALFARQRESAADEQAFRRHANGIAAQVERTLKAPLESLYAVDALLGTLPNLRPEAFAKFADPLLRRHPSLAALEWGVVVRDADRESFERTTSELFGHPFTLREPDANGHWVRAQKRDWYAPLLLLEPNPFDLEGLDLAFAPERKAVVLQALAGGDLFATRRTRLVEDPPNIHAIVFYLPLYEGAPTTAEERVNAVRGYGVALYRIDPLVRTAVTDADLGSSTLALIDRTIPVDPQQSLLYESRPGAATPAPAKFRESRPIELGSRTWEVLISDSPRTIVSFWLTLAIGTMASLLLASLASMRESSSRLRKEYTRVKSLGEYTLIRELQSGGMGRVYEARHALLRRRAAIKLIKGNLGDASIRRFDREAKATSELTHPNTVTLFDYGRTNDGEFYYVMEFIEGMNLQQLVSTYGAQPAARVRHILLQVCGALSEAHERGFVHRDVKPANIMLCVRGNQHDFVKVLDFGLVRDHEASESAITRVGSMVGTLRYMAPETFTTMAPATPRADLYAVGCVAYYLLTGRNVFEAKTDVALMAAHVATPPAPMKSVPKELEKIVMQCLEKNPEARFASAAHLALALERLSVGVWTELDAADWWRTHGEEDTPPPESLAGSRSISFRSR